MNSNKNYTDFSFQYYNIIVKLICKPCQFNTLPIFFLSVKLEF